MADDDQLGHRAGDSTAMLKRRRPEWLDEAIGSYVSVAESAHKLVKTDGTGKINSSLVVGGGGGGISALTAGTGITIADPTGPTSTITAKYGTIAGTAAEGNDARLSNSRTPTAHAASHQNGGSDEVAVATPAANAIPKAGAGSTLAIGWLPLGVTSSTVTVGNDARLSDARTPTAHAASHMNGGSDEVSTASAAANAIPKAGAGGTLAIGWLPLGTSATTVTVGNDSRLSNARTPTAHAASHQHGGSDEVATATPGANAIPKAGAGGTLAVGFLPVGVISNTVAAGDDSRFLKASALRFNVTDQNLTTTPPSSGDILRYNGTNWAGIAVSATAAASIVPLSGAGGRLAPDWLGGEMVQTSGDKTLTTSLANVSGYSWALDSGKTYTFTLKLIIDVTTASSGIAAGAFTFSGTTSVFFHGWDGILTTLLAPQGPIGNTTSGGSLSTPDASAIRPASVNYRPIDMVCQLTTTSTGTLTLALQAQATGTVRIKNGSKVTMCVADTF